MTSSNIDTLRNQNLNHKGTSLDFNNSTCTWNPWKYIHACSNCGSQNHGRPRCFKFFETPTPTHGSASFHRPRGYQRADLSQDVATVSRVISAVVEPSVFTKGQQLDPSVFTLAKSPTDIEWGTNLGFPKICCGGILVATGCPSW